MTGKKPSLEEVLEQVNSLGDWDPPATSANDRAPYPSLDYPLHKVAIWGEVDAAEVLVAHGADVNAPGEDDDRPLHRAHGREMVIFLLSHGADPDLTNMYGGKALRAKWRVDADIQALLPKADDGSSA